MKIRYTNKHLAADYEKNRYKHYGITTSKKISSAQSGQIAATSVIKRAIVNSTKSIPLYYMKKRNLYDLNVPGVGPTTKPVLEKILEEKLDISYKVPKMGGSRGISDEKFLKQSKRANWA
ncbi:hypothetical protein ACFLZZ_01225 [Nanoarchaeota archaeon]